MHEFEAGVLPWGPPFTLGHENAGWVHAVGPGVSGFEIDEPVAVYGPWGCGSCAHCRLGIETLCENPDSAPVPMGGGGLGLDGGMAEYMLVPSARFLVPLPDGLDPVTAAPLTDAGLTPYHAVRRSWWKLPPGATAVVIGVGGLGHLAVQILKATTAARIIAVDTRMEALALAADNGADISIRSGSDTTGEIRAYTSGRGADVVLDFVGSDSTVALGSVAARMLGDLTIVGSPAARFRCRSSPCPTSYLSRRRIGAAGPSSSRCSTSAHEGSFGPRSLPLAWRRRWRLTKPWRPATSRAVLSLYQPPLEAPRVPDGLREVIEPSAALA